MDDQKLEDPLANSGIRMVFSIAALWWMYLTLNSLINDPFILALAASTLLLVGFYGAYYFIEKFKVRSTRPIVWGLVIFLLFWKIIASKLLMDLLVSKIST